MWGVLDGNFACFIVIHTFLHPFPIQFSVSNNLHSRTSFFIVRYFFIVYFIVYFFIDRFLQFMCCLFSVSVKCLSFPTYNSKSMFKVAKQYVRLVCSLSFPETCCTLLGSADVGFRYHLKQLFYQFSPLLCLTMDAYHVWKDRFFWIRKYNWGCQTQRLMEYRHCWTAALVMRSNMLFLSHPGHFISTVTT